MPFRTLEISNPAEVHVCKGQLVVTNEEGTFSIPLEDLSTIVCSGPNIRMSTMAQCQIAAADISMMIINEKYHPSCILLPVESNVRQTLVMRGQIEMIKSEKDQIWLSLIKRKIENQSRGLTLLGCCGAEKILQYTCNLNITNVDVNEANAAKDYFNYLHPGLNRRNDDPVNSCLNYGYAVLRNAIIRTIMLAGLLPAIGFHHDNYLNAFNLADDLIEPWRPFVDIIALKDPGTSTVLSKGKRRELAMVLHNACLINEHTLSVQSGIEEMINRIRTRIMAGSDTELLLPTLLPVKVIEGIKE
ncbi:type II CRISPR-associated endonuclease Cas1 [Baileyella intestinalis]|uniref:type II CRISPR-associated endonuclease Cas1 n=1 Tax=Baileyella intestinalis TaxID=2606709 RepID=UPI0022E6CF5D|nr:type II CRISPR-associated endonuclease Cas1 [Baileyella intestinalis]